MGRYGGVRFGTWLSQRYDNDFYCAKLCYTNHTVLLKKLTYFTIISQLKNESNNFVFLWIKISKVKTEINRKVITRI